MANHFYTIIDEKDLDQENYRHGKFNEPYILSERFVNATRMASQQNIKIMISKWNSEWFMTLWGRENMCQLVLNCYNNAKR